MKPAYILFFLLIIFSNMVISQDYSRFSIDLKLLPEEINSKDNDYAPAQTPDGKILFFSSDRKGGFGKADIYFTALDEKRYVKIFNSGKSFNTEDYEGAVSIAGDGKTIVFAANNREGGFGKEDIYIGDLIDNKLCNIKNLGANINSKYWDSQPCISYDGKTIYFVSNRKDGLGGEDIYYTKKLDDGSWSRCENLGRVINTEENERSPFISTDGCLLFFSSDGFKGYGKKDIYVSHLENGSWSNPVNLGPVINSPDDEVFFIALSDYRYFYFSSNRKGGLGEMDIYYGSPNIFGYGVFKLVINVLDSISRQPVNANVDIIDPESGLKINTFETNAFKKDYVTLLPAERNFQIQIRSHDNFFRILDIEKIKPNIEKKVEILVAKNLHPITAGNKDEFKLTINVLDSATRAPLSGKIVITEKKSDAKHEIDVNTSKTNYELVLPSGNEYNIECRADGFPNSKKMNLYIPPNTGEKKVEILFDPVVVKEFDFVEIEGYKVPFFVTGYYRPNTKINLDSLLILFKGPLKKANFIEKFSKGSQRYNMYLAYASSVENIFKTVETYAVNEFFPYFKDKLLPDEILEISVTGYVDPRPYAGKYLESGSIWFEDLFGKINTIGTGDYVDNFSLSGLRAWFTGNYIRSLFEQAAEKGKKEYIELYKSGKVRFRHIAGYIKSDNTAYEMQRHIKVRFSRIKQK